MITKLLSYTITEDSNYVNFKIEGEGETIDDSLWFGEGEMEFSGDAVDDDEVVNYLEDNMSEDVFERVMEIMREFVRPEGF